MTPKERKALLSLMAASAERRASKYPFGETATRRLLTPATSYNREEHTVEATISVGAPVKRDYGIEVLRITPDAVNLGYIKNGRVPLPDSHNQFGIDHILGKVTAAWASNGELRGRLKFAANDAGKAAEGMVERGEISGII
jgi:hypothetical protein